MNQRNAKKKKDNERIMVMIDVKYKKLEVVKCYEITSMYSSSSIISLYILRRCTCDPKTRLKYVKKDLYCFFVVVDAPLQSGNKKVTMCRSV